MNSDPLNPQTAPREALRFLGIDQGTSATKSVLLDIEGREHGSCSIPVAMLEDAPPVARQDPDVLFASIVTAWDRLAASAAANGGVLSAAGLALQRSGVCAWEPSGKLLHALMTWRDESLAESFRGRDLGLITERSGLPAIANYAGGKIAHLQKRFAAPAIVGTLDSFITAKFGAAPHTEDSMAARTMLYSLDRGQWDPELCALLGADSTRLAPIQPSLGVHGNRAGVALSAMLGDAQSSLIGSISGSRPAVLNLGTLASLMVRCDTPRRLPGCLTSVLYSQGSGAARRRYFLSERNTISSGSIIALIRGPEGRPALDEIQRWCEDAADTPLPVAFVPAGALLSPGAAGHLPALVSARPPAGHAAFARMLVESVGAFACDMLLCMQADGLIPPQTPIIAAGGLARLDYLLHFIADGSGLRLERAASSESTARGAALCAMSAYGALAEPWQLNRAEPQKVFEPRRASNARERVRLWRELRDQAERGEAPPDLVLPIHRT